MPQQNFENIAVVRLSSMGDVIFAMPAVTLLRKKFPQAKITWIVEDRVADLLVNNQLVDQVIIMPRKKWQKMKADGLPGAKRRRAMRAFGQVLREKKFDLAIDFQGNIKSGLVTRATRAPIRVGFTRSETREPNWLFTNRRPPIGQQTRHRIDRDIELLTAVGIEPEFHWPPFHYQPKEKEKTDHFLSSLSGEGPLILLNPGTSEWLKTKRWDSDYFSSLADYFVLSRDAKVLVTWGPGEQHLAQSVVKQATQNIEISPEPWGIRALSYLVSQADLMVGSDTGPVHLAAIQDRPCVILFGPSDPRLYYPYGHKERAIYGKLACSPCRYRTCPEVDCMRVIGPRQVAKICDAVLDGKEFEGMDLTPQKGAPT